MAGGCAHSGNKNHGMAYSSLKESVRRQREALTGLINEPMRELALRCAGLMDDRAAVFLQLREAGSAPGHGKHDCEL